MMEPAAPGTEDEVKLSVQSNISKKQSEQERLLSIKTRLPGGKIGNVFEFSFFNGSEHWYCNLCKCPIMGRVYHHEIGKRHTSNMQAAGNHQPSCEPESTIQVAPGEPVPPGFEGEIEKIAQIQERLDSFTVGPLIGLEYLFELQEYDREKEPSYLCLLCDKKGDPRTVIAHLASYNHITQYAQRHFVTCFRALSPYITKQFKRNWQATMQKIAEAIENKFGRLKPHVVDRETFHEKRTYYQNLVASGPHFSEKSGVTFEELVDKEQLTKSVEDEMNITKYDTSKRSYRKSGSDLDSSGDYIKSKRSPSPPVVAKPKKPKPNTSTIEKRRSLSSVSSISSSDLSDFEQSVKPTLKKERDYEGRPKQNWEKSPSFRRRRSRSTSRHRFDYKKYNRRSQSRSVSPPQKSYNDRHQPHGAVHPWQRSDYIRSRADTSADRAKQKSDKLEEFKKLSGAIENDMDRILKQHEQNPEKHPQYSEEWKKFWNRRYKELQAEGKDASTYDFKPEWIEVWNKRLLELHNVEVKLKKDALRKRLGLPDEPAPICFKITGKKKPGHREERKQTKLAPIASIPDQDPDIIVIEDKDEDTVSSKRSHSPWESEPGSRSTSHRSKEKSRSRERSRISREKSRERSRRSRDRSRSRSRDRGWRGRTSHERERDYRGAYSRDKGYYRDVYRKTDLPEYIKPPRVMRDVTRHPVHSPSAIAMQSVEAESDPDDGNVNIVGVLRLLTALEEKLGSLGPKVIDLLAQALALEKAEGNSSETLLDNEVNCVLFETVKEKLKGQLLADLVDFTQEKAFKNAIKKIASLIHFASERKKEKEKEKAKVDPIKVPGIGTVDKSAIAKQIATALVLQGKTDVTQAELEQLINAVVGMAEASRNLDKPVTTASFLQQLSQQKPILENKSLPPIGSLYSALKSSVESTSTNNMEGLSDSDLQTLLQNFKDLCTDEQHNLISYLKQLEAREPERVERLRKFVNLDTNTANTASTTITKIIEKPVAKTELPTGRASPFASRLAGLNPTVEENVDKDKKDGKSDKEPPMAKVTLDSDEEYSFEDVFKAAKQNVTEKEQEEKAKSMMFKTDDFSLSNAKSIIANLMGQFNKTNNTESSMSSASNLLGLSVTMPESTSLTETISQSLPANLDNFPINLNSLANAISTAQQATADLNRRNNQNRPICSSNVSYPQKGSQGATAASGNYPLTVAYPQQHQYMNQQQHVASGGSGGGAGGGGGFSVNRLNFNQQNHFPPFNHDGNNANYPPGSEQYDNYGRRW